jgi:hypothetical protein
VQGRWFGFIFHTLNTLNTLNTQHHTKCRYSTSSLAVLSSNSPFIMSRPTRRTASTTPDVSTANASLATRRTTRAAAYNYADGDSTEEEQDDYVDDNDNHNSTSNHIDSDHDGNDNHNDHDESDSDDATAASPSSASTKLARKRRRSTSKPTEQMTMRELMSDHHFAGRPMRSTVLEQEKRATQRKRRKTGDAQYAIHYHRCSSRSTSRITSRSTSRITSRSRRNTCHVTLTTEVDSCFV